MNLIKFWQLFFLPHGGADFCKKFRCFVCGLNFFLKKTLISLKKVLKKALFSLSALKKSGKAPKIKFRVPQRSARKKVWFSTWNFLFAGFWYKIDRFWKTLRAADAWEAKNPKNKNKNPVSTFFNRAPKSCFFWSGIYGKVAKCPRHGGGKILVISTKSESANNGEKSKNDDFKQPGVPPIFSTFFFDKNRIFCLKTSKFLQKC